MCRRRGSGDDGLDRARRTGRLPGQPAGQISPVLLEQGAPYDDVDQTQLPSGWRVVLLTRCEGEQGAASSDGLREALAPAPGGHDAARHLVDADPDVVGGDADVGGQGDLGATAESMPVERGDD